MKPLNPLRGNQHLIPSRSSRRAAARVPQGRGSDACGRVAHGAARGLTWLRWTGARGLGAGGCQLLCVNGRRLHGHTGRASWSHEARSLDCEEAFSSSRRRGVLFFAPCDFLGRAVRQDADLVCVIGVNGNVGSIGAPANKSLQNASPSLPRAVQG